jgi:hypothetical protein
MAAFGFFMGGFEFKVIKGKLNVENSIVSAVNTSAFSFKMLIKYSGEITISDETGRGFSRTVFCEDVFDGLNLG